MSAEILHSRVTIDFASRYDRNCGQSRIQLCSRTETDKENAMNPRAKSRFRPGDGTQLRTRQFHSGARSRFARLGSVAARIHRSGWRHCRQLCRPHPPGTDRGLDQAGQPDLAPEQRQTNEPALRLAQKLVDATFADKVFFANSGAEANEAAFAGAALCNREIRPGQGRIHRLQQFIPRSDIFTVSVGGQAKYSMASAPSRRASRICRTTISPRWKRQFPTRPAPWCWSRCRARVA